MQTALQLWLSGTQQVGGLLSRVYSVCVAQPRLAASELDFLSTLSYETTKLPKAQEDDSVFVCCFKFLKVCKPGVSELQLCIANIDSIMKRDVILPRWLIIMP